MAIVINGSGTVTGLSAGGLPDNTVDNGTMADDAIGVAELSATGTASNSTYLRGDNSWATAGVADDYFASSGLSAKDLGDGLHIKTGDSGLGSVNSNFDQLIVENDTTAGISILTGTSNEGVLAFSDSGGHRGLVRYAHATDKMSFATGDADRMNIDSSGNVGIGSTPSSLYSGYTSLQVGGNGTLWGQAAAGGSNNFWMGQNVRAGTDGNEKAITTGTSSAIHMSGGSIELYCSNSVSADANITKRYLAKCVRDSDTAMSIRHGNFVANGTGQGAKISADANQGSIIIETSLTSSRSLMSFVNGNGTVGTIATSGSATAYNTSSDYRLKENVDYDWDATTRLKQLKPARFNFIADDTNTLRDGFLAHEVSSIVPEAISGEKDAMIAEELYVEGDYLPDGKNIGDVKVAVAPDYQAIDQSKLVPLLVKTIQELEARITILENP